MRTRTRVVFYFAAIFSAATSSTFAQSTTTTPPPEARAAASAAAPESAADAETLAKLTTLRDAFIADIQAAGFTPKLAAPQIVFDNPPSHGNYDEKTNVLRIATWRLLTPDDRAHYQRLAALSRGVLTAEEIFNDGVRKWVFTHELAHWWQACQGKFNGDHWSAEYGANRIAAAYWRAHDPVLMERIVRTMKRMDAAEPSPLPAGADMKTYFNANWDTISPTPAYRWFQGEMILQVVAEIPLPGFKDALATPA
jgi:hypothetical protein